MRIILTTTLVAFATACGKPAEDPAYDAALLEQYRAVLPSQDAAASSPGESGGARAIGGDAEYPHHARPIVLGINGAVLGIIALLDAVTSIEPTVYNSETKEFFWGPYDNDHDFGSVAAYIRENP